MEERRTDSEHHQRSPRRLVQTISREKAPLRSFSLRRGGLIGEYQRLQRIGLESVRNELNHVHFTDQRILIHLHDSKHNENLLLKAHVEPCLGTALTCRFSDELSSRLAIENYEFHHLIIDNGQSMMLIPANLISASKTIFTVDLPEMSYVVGQRRTKRHKCRDVEVELIQNGFSARGRLLNFSPMGFSVRVRPDSSTSFHWFNPKDLTTIQLRSEQQILFSGRCRCLRQTGLLREREIVLAPERISLGSSAGNRIRNPREHLVPSPRVIFEHPLIEKKVQLEVSDISSSGFSVFENANEAVLLPGMIIPELDIDFAGGIRMRCAAQVIYRQEEFERVTRSGIALLDMDTRSFTHFNQILANAHDPYTHISNEVDTEALWRFFFESGFLYPKKYSLIQSHRDHFRATFEKLYRENPEVARHFTYQRNGRIYGHVSMVRAYERAWMMQHHAATKLESRRIGFNVLKQTMYHLNAAYRFPSSKMDYICCYYRPENRFPYQVFGGFHKFLNNPRGCSLDLFSYLPYTTLSLATSLPRGWSLEECSSLDLWELSRFYDRESGGLLLDMLQIEGRNSSTESFEKLYANLGFVRSWRAYALVYKGQLKAVLIVNRSDLGFNLSELLNCVKVLVTNPEGLPWEMLSAAINQLTGVYETEKVPLLVYPFTYLDGQNAPRAAKEYFLWICDTRGIGKLMEYGQKRLRVRWD